MEFDIQEAYILPMVRSLFFSLYLGLPFTLAAVNLVWDGDPGLVGVQDGSGNWNTLDINRWVQDGTPQAWNNAALDTAVFGAGSGAAGSVTLTEAITAGGLTFNTTGSGNYTLTGNVLTLAGTPIITANVAATINSSLAGTAGFTKTGTGTLTLSGSVANTLTGNIIISGGSLVLSKSANVAAIAGNVEIQTGGTLQWTMSHQVADSASITISGGAINFNNQSETFANYTQTAGGQTGSNNGAISVTGTFAMSGGTVYTINSNGRLSANKIDLTGYTATGNTILLGGDGNALTTLTIGSGGLVMNGQTIMLNRTTTAARLGNELILNGDITSSGNSNINTNSTAQTITEGALNQLNVGSVNRTWTVTADTSGLSVPLAGTGSLIKAGPGTLSINGSIHNINEGALTVIEGTLLLNKTAGINATGKDIRVNGGTLKWNLNDQIPDNGTIYVESGPTLSFNNKNEVFARYVQTGGTGISSDSGNTGIVEITESATISGGGTITVNSGGRMTINQLTITNITGLGVNIGGNSAARITTLTIGPGGLSLSGQSVTLNPGSSTGNQGSELILNGNFTGSGTTNINRGAGAFGVAQINLGSSERTFTISSGTTTSNVPLIGTNGGLIKAGTGTLTLSATNTYTGKTTISAGTLILTATGSIADTQWIQIDSGSTFNVNAITGGFTFSPATGTRVISGSGSINGSLVLGGVAQIRPGTTSNPATIGTAGDGIGTLAISGNLSLTPSSPNTVASFQIRDASTADKITVGGNLTLNANTRLEVTFDETYTPAYGHTWDLIDWVGLISSTGFLTGDNYRTGNDGAGNEGYLNLPDLTNWGFLWEISSLTNGGALTITVVPEPGRAILFSFGLFALGLRRRR